MILFTADLHQSANPRDAYRDQWFAKLPELARRSKASCVIIGGDLTEEKDKHGSWLVNRICDHVQAVSIVCPVIIYKGNHDYVSEDEPYFSFLNHIDYVTFISNPTELTIEGLGKCLFLPHTRNWEHDWRDFDLRSRDNVFLHASVAGADLGNNRRADGVETDRLFDKRQRVYAGDIHIPQSIGNVSYVGAPYTVDFGDDYKPRVMLIHPDRFVSLPCTGPQKRLVEITMKQTLEVLDKLETTKGDVFKVRVHITKFTNDAWSKVVDVVREWGEERSVIIHAVQPVTAEPEGTRVMRTKSRARVDDKQTVATFGKSRGVDERTLKTGYYIMDKSE